MLMYSEAGMLGQFRGRDVRTSYLQRLSVRQNWFRSLLPLYPRAIESLDVSEHDLVLSSSSAFAHGVRARPGAVHVCYCYTPFRYAWHDRALALSEVRAPLRPLLNRTLERIRRWDVEAASRVTHYVAISELTRERIGDVYGRDAAVVHPSVDIGRFTSIDPKPEDYFLVVSECVPHKRIDVALDAARRAGARVKVAGGGPSAAELQRRFGDVAEFVGRVSDEEVAKLYSRALALIVPSLEEFGMTAVEAQAAGRPVVALARGGARETVIDGVTGVLVGDGSVDEFAEALREVDFTSFSPNAARRQAACFSPERFGDELRAQVELACR
jgi:glycosyltransferase involved in cell wall biosynthesis